LGFGGWCLAVGGCVIRAWGVQVSMAASVERDRWSERLHEQAAEMRSLTRELLRSLAETAGRIADTEDEVARVHEDLAASGVCPIAGQELREHAERARQFAEHERREQQRWSSRVGSD
jgi:DNA repair exonuclease SbcCD ATPase subunit